MSRGFYDRIVGPYAVLAEPSERRCRERGIEALGLQAGERVLEIGARTGRGLVALSRRVRPGGWVTGLDNSSRMLAAARGTLREHPAARLVLGDARVLPFAPDTFDAALSSFTLESFAAPDIARVLSEFHRVLRAGGRLAVVALATALSPSPMTALYEWIHERFPTVADCRPIDASAEVRRAGFRVTFEDLMHIWGLRVAVVTALKRDRAAPLCIPGPLAA